jgi:hypothetical protein
MPVHDWSRVSAGTFHHFHSLWVPEISNVLNDGLLPPDYYAMAEQIVGDMGPDVITLQSASPNGEGGPAKRKGVLAVAEEPPKVCHTATAGESEEYALKQKSLVIRHSSGDRIIALIEVLSPGNKASHHAIRSFLDKVLAALYRGYHLLLIDLNAPGPRDPQGIHGALWAEISDQPYAAPAGKPLTLVAYTAGLNKKAYVEPVAVGDALRDMPLFLDPEWYVLVPLEATYQAAYRGVPRRWRSVLEGTNP